MLPMTLVRRLIKANTIRTRSGSDATRLIARIKVKISDEVSRMVIEIVEMARVGPL